MAAEEKKGVQGFKEQGDQGPQGERKEQMCVAFFFPTLLCLRSLSHQQVSIKPLILIHEAERKKTTITEN